MPEADAEQEAGLPVGEYLRKVRESRGLGLDEAARVTKIGKNYLVALEEGQFDKLPSAAYIKGFLRLYAGFLSLSGDEVVHRYEESLPSARPPVEVKPDLEPRRVEIMERVRLAGPSRWVIPALLLCLVILAALFYSDGGEKGARPVAKPVEAPAPAPAPVVVQPQLSSAHAAPGAPPATTAPAAQLPAASPATTPSVPPITPGTGHHDGVVLRLRFNQDSWLSITIDDSISQRYDLKAGDIIEWKGTRSFVVDIGDGAAAEGEFNGRALKALGEAGKPAHVELKGE